MQSKKVILDTNLWISFLITRKFQEVDDLIQNQQITLIFSNESIEEFVQVAYRPKFRKYFTRKDIKHILDSFDQYGELTTVLSNIKICRDQKDNFLLNLALDSKADYLVTGDKDLLVLEKLETTTILNFTDFIQKFKHSI